MTSDYKLKYRVSTICEDRGNVIIRTTSPHDLRTKFQIWKNLNPGDMVRHVPSGVVGLYTRSLLSREMDVEIKVDDKHRYSVYLDECEPFEDFYGNRTINLEE